VSEAIKLGEAVSGVKCLILAAGNGGRLAEVCDSKPLLQIAGLPLIERTVAPAQQAGISDFYVVTGYAAEGVESFLAELSRRRSVRITSIRSPDWQLGNGASLLSARRELDGPFVMMMADHIVDEAIVGQIVREPVDDGAVVLAVDYRVNGNRLVDPGDVTKVQQVLVEGAKTNADDEIVYTGRNRANKLVHFRTSANPTGLAADAGPEIGHLVDVQISKTTPWSLQGEAYSPIPA